MLERLANTISKQLGLLLLWGALGLGAAYWVDFRPRNDISISKIAEGIAASILLLLAIGICHLLMLLIFPAQHRSALESYERMWKKRNIWTQASYAIIAATGEEYFLRGCLVGYLASYSNLGSFSQFFAVALATWLALLLAFRGRNFLTLTTVKGVEGLLLSVMYLSLHSLTAIALARFITELVSIRFLSKSGTGTVVKITSRLQRLLRGKWQEHGTDSNKVRK